MSAGGCGPSLAKKAKAHGCFYLEFEAFGPGTRSLPLVKLLLYKDLWRVGSLMFAYSFFF